MQGSGLWGLSTNRKLRHWILFSILDSIDVFFSVFFKFLWLLACPALHVRACLRVYIGKCQETAVKVSRDQRIIEMYSK
jgi:hypothetical protein